MNIHTLKPTLLFLPLPRLLPHKKTPAPKKETSVLEKNLNDGKLKLLRQRIF